MSLFDKRGERRPPSLPTVKFDANQVTGAVGADVRAALAKVPELDAGNLPAVLEAAMRSIRVGRDLYTLSQALIAAGLSKKRAGEVAINLHNRATSEMTRGRQGSLGITEAVWLHSGAPCFDPRGEVTLEKLKCDAAHKAADGRRYSISQGLKIGKRSVWPGQEPGCKCISKSLIPGFD